jgi:hypothetical protein
MCRLWMIGVDDPFALSWVCSLIVSQAGKVVSTRAVWKESQCRGTTSEFQQNQRLGLG